MTIIIISIICYRWPELRSRYSNSLRAGRSGDRIPVGKRLSASVQTGPGAHPTSYTMGTWSFQGVKRPGRGVDHPPPSSAEVKETVKLYICSYSGPSWPVLGRTLPLPFVISVMKGIYNYILETNHVSRVHGVAAVLQLQSVVCIECFVLIIIIIKNMCPCFPRQSWGLQLDQRFSNCVSQRGVRGFEKQKCIMAGEFY